MERSSSEFSLTTAETANEIARKWAKMRFDEPQGREYCETEYTLLLNGRTQENEFDLEDEEVRARDLVRDEIVGLVEQQLKALLAEHERALAEASRLAAEQRALADAQRQQAVEAQERAELARLQAKFGSKA